MTTKRMTRMITWIEKNPHTVYADYRDELPQNMAQMILDGEFDKFWETAWESEWDMMDYPGAWDYWESEFASEFGFDSWDQVPARIQEVCLENRFVDTSDYWKTVCSNTRFHVVARLVKRSGEYIEFPNEDCVWHDAGENAKRRQYLKRHCGIDLYNGRVAESYYDYTYLSVLGRVDLNEILESQKKPEKIVVSPECFTLGFNGSNGSGTCNHDRYKGKERVMHAELYIDGTRGYGVDETYGLVGECWSNEIQIAA